MSATNTTTNYGLPIFIETDKPAWLVDFNGAMRKIDAQMKTNADAIAEKSPILTFNDTAEIDFTKSGDIITANLASGVSDKVGRALVTPIAPPSGEQLVGINTSGQQEYLTIGDGLLSQNGTISTIDFNLTDTASYNTYPSLPSGISVHTVGLLQKALNAGKTVGKIYGNPIFNSSRTTDGRLAIPTNITVAATGQSYAIACVGTCFPADAHDFSSVNLLIDANGNVSLESQFWANTRTYLYMQPCLYFFKNFGDVITP